MRVTTSLEEFEEIGQCYQAVAESNDGTPIRMLAIDNHESYTHTERFLLGFMPEEEVKEVTFWKDCTRGQQLKIPAWEARVA